MKREELVRLFLIKLWRIVLRSTYYEPSFTSDSFSFPSRYLFLFDYYVLRPYLQIFIGWWNYGTFVQKYVYDIYYSAIEKKNQKVQIRNKRHKYLAIFQQTNKFSWSLNDFPVLMKSIFKSQKMEDWIKHGQE